MPLPDRFCVDIPESVPVYSCATYCQPQPTISYRYPCESAVVYNYPSYSTVSYYNPYEVVVRNDNRNCYLKSETAAIRQDLNQIKYDINELKQYHACPCPPYYEIRKIQGSCCDSCQQKSSSNQTKYCCEGCKNSAHSVVTNGRAKTPNTTYQDSYRPPSTGPVQHPRPWVPSGYKNQYPHQRWNLSVPHSEP